MLHSIFTEWKWATAHWRIIQSWPVGLVRVQWLVGRNDSFAVPIKVNGCSRRCFHRYSLGFNLAAIVSWILAVLSRNSSLDPGIRFFDSSTSLSIIVRSKLLIPAARAMYFCSGCSMQVVAVDLKALTKMRMRSLANINISLVVAGTISGKLKAPAA